MADLQYDIGVNTRQAVQGLKQLQGQVNQTSEVFGKLKGAIAGIGIAAIVRNTFEMANSMRDLSSATGIALQNIVGFSQAMLANGSTIDRARDGLTDFVKNLGEAARGSSELQKAFIQTGVSLNDLRTLSEADILRKTIRGLADVSDSALRSAIGMKIFGESTKGVDLAGVNRDLDGFIARSAQSAQAIDSAARVNQSLKNSFATLQVELLNALKPLSDLAATILENTDLVRAFLKTFIDVALIAGSIIILKRFTTAIAAIGLQATRETSSIKTFFASLGTTAARGQWRQGMQQVRREFIELGNLLNRPNKFKNFANSLSVIGLGFARMLPLIGQVITGIAILNGVVEGFTGKGLLDWLDTAALKLEQFVAENFPNLHKSINELNDALGLAPSPMTQLAQQQADEAKKKLEEAAKIAKDAETQRREVIDAQTEQLQKQLQAYKDANSSVVKSLQDELTLLNYKDEELEYQRKILEFSNKYKEEVKKLQSELDILNKKPEENAHLIEGIKKHLEDVREEYKNQFPIIVEIANAIKEKARALKEADIAAEKLKESMAAVKNEAKTSADFIRDLQRSSQDAAFELSTLNMSELQKEVATIGRNIDRQVNDRIRDLRTLLANTTDPQLRSEIQRQIAEITAAGNVAIKTQSDIAKQSYEQQRSFQYGWKKAFESYADDATNAAKAAERIFEKTTQSMEDSIVSFAKTGKFEFRGFLASVVEDLLRSQVRQLLVNTFSLGGGSGGGSTIINTAKKLFSGFFADGGFIPSGTFGIVGERGPELISGPAQITPMGGMGNVTYNINAVDALSFKQLVAQDPSFIHAVATQGGRGIPQTRR